MKPTAFKVAAAAMFASAMLIGSGNAVAQDTRSKTITLWVDSATGQVFMNPGRGRRALTVQAAGPDATEIEHQVEQKVERKNEQDQAQLKADLVKQTQQTQDLSQQVAQIRPAWQDYIENFRNKFRVGAVVYADWRMYTHTGFGPTEQEGVNQPGPGNELFNSFDITRTYLNFYFTPTNDWTLRITPDVYRTFGSANPDKFGKVSAVNTNLSGNLGLRVKYVYLQYSKAFDAIGPMKGDTITFGQQQNPLVPWNEDLFNYRFVTYSPWNYLGLSSAQDGISVQGPIKFNELQYIDYDVGAFDNANYKQFEQANTKQAMARVSIYPFGAAWRFQGLGLTGFYDYGYGDVAPDTVSGTSKAHFSRIAAIVHYTAEEWGLAGEYDLGHNAFNSGNLFSGSGPADAFTFLPGTAPTATSYSDFAKMTSALQNNSRTIQRGFDFYGHAHIPNSPFTAFGLFQWFQPNTKVKLNPLDFQRWVAGVSYRYNEFLRIALSSQNLMFYHHQFDFPKSEADFFSPSAFRSPGTATIADAVPRDNHSFWLNFEFTY